jgi:hypothetical protein
MVGRPVNIWGFSKRSRVMKVAITAPQMQWFKAESAALMTAVVQGAGVMLGWDIGWVQGLITVVAVYASAYVTVKE